MPASNTSRRALTAGQLGIWRAQQLHPENPAFNIAEYVEIHGAVNELLFERAVRSAAEEAETSSMRFSEDENGLPYQWPDNVPWEFHQLDLSSHENPRLSADQWMRADATRVADLAGNEIFTQVLLKIREDVYFWYQRVHHIIGDGYSGSLFAARVAELYTAYSKNAHPPKRWFPGFDMMLDADTEYRSSESFGTDRSFWLDTMSNYPEPASLSGTPPTSTPHRLVRHTAELDAVAVNHFKSSAKRFGTSFTVIAVAAAALNLHRSNGAPEVVIGLPVTGRWPSSLRMLPGMAANVLPVRISVHPGSSVLDLVKGTSLAIRKALRHQRYRYEDIVRDLKAVGKPDLYSAMVNVMAFDYDLTFGDATSTAHNISGAQVNDISFSVYDRLSGSMDVVVDANEDLYSEDRLAETSRQFHAVLHWICQASFEEKIGQVDLLESGERQRILGELSGSAMEVDEKTLPQLIEAQVSAAPHATAVAFEGQELSYTELNTRANRLARLLVGRGVGPETLVGVALPRSADLVVALLAVLKAGGAYVPIDPDHPADRIAYMLDDARPVTVLTETSVLDSGVLPEQHTETVVSLDAPESVAQLASMGESDLTDPERAGALLTEHPAFVIYTSGSTGRPKGVAVSHMGVVNQFTWMQREYELTSADRVLHKTPVGFDVSVWELFWPLAAGAALVVARPGGHRDAHYLTNVIQDARVTVVQFVPSMLRLFLNDPAAGKCVDLRLVICAGEALPPELHREFEETLGASLYNMYGPTEATIAVTAWTGRPMGPADGPTPIGRPIDNSRVFVLDAALQPVAFGVPGELYLGGVQLARGYVGRAGLSAERFIANPFGVPGERMYRTGDLVKWRHDGTLAYLGRTDHQVKVRGFRIELGEIETALAAHDSVRQVAVVVREDRPGDQRIVAYVVPAQNVIVAPAALRAHAGTTLPEYMVPSAIVVLEALPLSANGKLDRSALPAPDYTLTTTRRAPTSPEERLLCLVFAEVLGVGEVGVEDNFFELGGHSLLAVTLVERLRARGVVVDVRSVFTDPTPAGLAASTGRAEVVVPERRVTAGVESFTPELFPLADLSQGEVDRIVEQIPGGAANIVDIYPLAPLQEGILFHHLLTHDTATDGTAMDGADDGDGRVGSDGGDVYVLPAVFGFDSRERLVAFVGALQRVVDRHEILRTAVVWEGLREPVQVVQREAAIPVTYFDAPDSPVSDVTGWLLGRLSRGFDLSRAPLMRVGAVPDPAGEGRWAALVEIHHIVQDHTALEVLLGEVQAFFTGAGEELSEPVPFR
ncbi:amino acid adenylation domain-containing protein, partial [Streptomyces sp. NPDC002306]